MTLDKHSEAAFTARFLVNFYQDNVGSDLADTFPGDHVFAVTSKKAAESGRPRHDQRQDPAAFAVKFQIRRTPQAPAGAGVDDFFLP